MKARPLFNVPLDDLVLLQLRADMRKMPGGQLQANEFTMDFDAPEGIKRCASCLTQEAAENIRNACLEGCSGNAPDDTVSEITGPAAPLLQRR